MIDSHTHSKYSKHAVGEIEEIVVEAIKKGIKILTITDHAPFPIDINNRLLISELENYIKDINYVKNKYEKDIKILKGVEADFIPKYFKYTERLLSCLDLDFVIGSIHSIIIKNKKINVWEIDKLYSNNFLDEYFIYLRELIESNLFDSIGHPDSILRGGFSELDFYKKFIPLISIIKQNPISYELNSSGFRKCSYDIKNKQNVQNIWTYPSKILVNELNLNNISFTIGSDAHFPRDVNKDIQFLLEELKYLNINNISYYENRKKIYININN